MASVLVAAIFVLLGLPFPSGAQTSCVPSPSGLVSWWPGNGNALDQVGGNNGTPETGVTYGPGEVQEGFVLPGGVGVPVGIATNLQLQDFTIEAWIRRANSSQSSNPDEQNVGYFFGFGPGGYGFGIDDNGSLFLSQVTISAEYSTNIAITDTNFHHVAVTKDGGTVVFYVDGAPYVAPFYDPAFYFTSPAAIGMPGTVTIVTSPPQWYAFWGTVNELSVYNRALATNEIESIYAAGGFGKCLNSSFIVFQPINENVGLGDDVTFTVGVAGVSPFAFQWSFDGIAIDQATNSILSLTDVQIGQAGTYSVIITNQFGSITSSNALLSVFTSPVIETQPLSQNILPGGTALFSVIAVGSTPLTYQWMLNDINIAQATNSILYLTNVQTAQTGTYNVEIVNKYGSLTSANAILFVGSPPSISLQPQSQAVPLGADVEFSVDAVGTSLAYQWLLNNIPLPGQTSSSLMLTDVSPTDTGQYVVVVSNAAGVVTSSPAVLNVLNGAAFLKPMGFPSLGVFDPVTNVLVDVGSGKMSGGASFTGSNITQAGASILVFTFSSFTLNPGLSITFTNGVNNTTAVAFLSQGNMAISGVIDANGQGAPDSIGTGPGGPDGNGPGAGGSGPGNSGGSGGGFGGAGAAGYLGALGGGTYSPDLTAGIIGGSSGGSGGGEFAGGGGGGGGALQLGALGSLVVTGAVLANGSVGSACVPPFVGGVGSGGGGSGGAILIQAANVTVSDGATILANGGSGGSIALGQNEYNNGGGGGGGGRIVVAFQYSGIDSGVITASGATSGYLDTAISADGSVLFIQFSNVPALPTLSALSQPSGELILAWPASATNYVLQTSSRLGVGAVWRTVSGGAVIGDNLVLTNQISGTAGFFRLQHN